MTQRSRREWSSLQYRDATDILSRFRAVEREVVNSETPDVIRNLRTNKLKREREMWQAAIFAHGIATAVTEEPVYLAFSEAQDYDCVAQWSQNGSAYCAPIQVKELVPETLNDRSSLGELLTKLAKYADSSDLIVALYLNRTMHLDTDALSVPKGLALGQIWRYGSSAPDASEFFLYGDLTRKPLRYTFSFPEPN